MKTGFVSETWVAAYCNDCGEPFPDYEENGPVLFSSADKAARYLTEHTDWRVDGDRISCDACQLTAHCTDQGHDWSPWETWTRPDRTAGPRSGRYRRCLHCYLIEQERSA